MFSPAMYLQFFDFLLPERSETDAHSFSQRHPSNWVDADEDEDDDGDADGNELCVQSTPPYYEEQ
jgi:cell cycle checkpoint control protein RAD9A